MLRVMLVLGWFVLVAAVMVLWRAADPSALNPSPSIEGSLASTRPARNSTLSHGGFPPVGRPSVPSREITAPADTLDPKR